MFVVLLTELLSGKQQIFRQINPASRFRNELIHVMNGLLSFVNIDKINCYGKTGATIHRSE